MWNAPLFTFSCLACFCVLLFPPVLPWLTENQAGFEKTFASLHRGSSFSPTPLGKPPASAGLRIRCFPQPLSGSRYQKQKQIKAIAGNAGEWCQPLFSDLSPWGLFHSCKLPQSTPARVLGCQWELSVYLKKNLLLHSQLPIYVQSWAVVPSDMTYLFIF